jgi:hypothetical protein
MLKRHFVKPRATLTNQEEETHPSSRLCLEHMAFSLPQSRYPREPSCTRVRRNLEDHYKRLINIVVSWRYKRHTLQNVTVSRTIIPFTRHLDRSKPETRRHIRFALQHPTHESSPLPASNNRRCSPSIARCQVHHLLYWCTVRHPVEIVYMLFLYTSIALHEGTDQGRTNVKSN